jgi:hypothetical protein
MPILSLRGAPTMSPSDPLRIMCPNLTCRKILAVPQSARGKTVRCRGCGTNIRVPPPNKTDTPSEKTGEAAKP